VGGGATQRSVLEECGLKEGLLELFELALPFPPSLGKPMVSFVREGGSGAYPAVKGTALKWKEGGRVAAG
jgi:hypothetical protein